MTSNEIGGIAWGIIAASWLALHYGIDSRPFLTTAMVAAGIMVLVIGYNWGKWKQKRRMEKKDD